MKRFVGVEDDIGLFFVYENLKIISWELPSAVEWIVNLMDFFYHKVHELSLEVI